MKQNGPISIIKTIYTYIVQVISNKKGCIPLSVQHSMSNNVKVPQNSVKELWKTYCTITNSKTLKILQMTHINCLHTKTLTKSCRIFEAKS